VFGSRLGTNEAQDIISTFRKLKLTPPHLPGEGALTVDATIIGDVNGCWSHSSAK
jgi:hypothetical protein